MENTILPNQERARHAMVALGVCAMTIMMAAGAQLWQADLITSEELTIELAEQSDNIVRAFAGLYLISLIVGAVFFIRWSRRAYANLHRLEKSMLSYQEGWAAGAWFVPILNLGRPYSILRETWREMQYAIPNKVETEGEKSAGLVNAWWTCWLIYNLGSQIASRIGRDTNLEDLLARIKYGTYADVFGIAAAVLAILMVRQISQFELELESLQRIDDPSEHLVV